MWWCTKRFLCYSLPPRMDCRRTVNCYSSLKVHLDQRISDRQTYLREMVSLGKGPSKGTTLLLLFAEGKTCSTANLKIVWKFTVHVSQFKVIFFHFVHIFLVILLVLHFIFLIFATRTQSNKSRELLFSRVSVVCFICHFSLQLNLKSKKWTLLPIEK